MLQGIETVRRDGCPLLVKMLEKVLRILFTTKDLSEVKGYLYRQWTRILTDRAAVGDFIFAKEVCTDRKWERGGRDGGRTHLLLLLVG